MKRKRENTYVVSLTADWTLLLLLLLLAHHTCLEATLFICTASPTPHESFSRAGSYNPTRFEGNVRGPASGFLNGTRAARASASLSAAAAALEECRVERRTPLLLLPGRGRRVAPPTLAVYRVRNISVWYVRRSSLVRLVWAASTGRGWRLRLKEVR